MPKHWQGISFEKKLIKEGDKEQEVVIAMTQNEENDRSYRQYLYDSVEEKTKNELKKVPDKQIDPKKREVLGKMLGEIKEFERRRRSQFPRKYF